MVSGRRGKGTFGHSGFSITAINMNAPFSLFEAGIVVTVTCGYLEEDPNPMERIYMLATWNRSCQTACCCRAGRQRTTG